MTSDQPPSRSPAQKSEQESEQASDRREAQSAGAAKAAYAAEAVSPWSEPSADPSHDAEAQDASADQAGALSPESNRVARRQTIWLSIGAGLAGGALMAIVLVPAGLITSRDEAAGALDARLARLEQQ